MLLPIQRSRSGGLAALLTATLLLAGGAAAQVPPSKRPKGPASQKGKLAVEDTFTEFWNREVFEVPVPRRPIEPAREVVVPVRAPVAGEPVVLTWAINGERNSRLPVAVPPPGPDAAPTVRWKAELPPGTTPASVLSSGDRLVVGGLSNWAVYDRGGRLIASRAFWRSNLAIDSISGLLFAGDREGLLEVWRLSDGAKAGAIELLETANHGRQFLAKRGGSLVVVSQERDADVHAPPVQKSMVEIVNLGNLAGPDRLGPRVVKDVIWATNVLLSALHGNDLVLATRDRIYFLNLELQFQRAWSGSFLPLGLSLDEGGRAYLIVRAEGRVSLWGLSAEGQRLWSVPVPPECVYVIQPPIVGYDHTVYVVSAQQILAVAPDGKVRWQRAGKGRISGAVAAANDLLVASEGTQVAAWDLEGERRVLHDFNDELATPPVLAPDGLLYAASRSYLYAVQLPR